MFTRKATTETPMPTDPPTVPETTQPPTTQRE